MPKIAIDYSTREVSFYKFVCNDPEIKSSYVGSTVDFTKRKASHKSICNNPNSKDYNLKIYQTIRENGGWEEWRMIEIEKRLVKDKRDAEKIEQEWIEKIQTDMNGRRAFIEITKEEYIKQYYIQYHLEHKEEVNEKRRQHHLENREKLNERRRIRKLEKKQQST